MTDKERLLQAMNTLESTTDNQEKLKIMELISSLQLQISLKRKNKI